MKLLEKNRAIELRKQGKTFSEILKEIHASKSSLSYWLNDIELTQEQLRRIRYKNDKIKEKFVAFNALRKKEAQTARTSIFGQAAAEIDGLSERELRLIGIALYWAEGYKGAGWGSVSFVNADPGMIKLMMRWFRIVYGIPEDKFRIRIQCYNEEKVKECEEYWSQITDIPRSQFTKPYLRISPTSKKTTGNLCPFGICNVRISDIRLLIKIKGWIKGISGAIV